jgi:hypothetical protein
MALHYRPVWPAEPPILRSLGPKGGHDRRIGSLTLLASGTRAIQGYQQIFASIAARRSETRSLVNKGLLRERAINPGH